MELLDLMRIRRSIRKYTGQQVPKADVEAIMEAGLYAPNAGGGQRTLIRAVCDPELCDKLGRMNVACFDRSRLSGGFVCDQQPSIIDDPTIQSGFYGAPTVCVVFAPQNFLYSVPDAFCCAENMVLAAAERGIASCIIARAEDTFAAPEAAGLLEKWKIPKQYTARCFVLLGYCDGPYPAPKPRKPGRAMIIE